MCIQAHQAIVGNKILIFHFQNQCHSLVQVLSHHHWIVHSEHFILSSLGGFPPLCRWEDAASCQEALPPISFLSHKYLLIHPVGLMSSRRKFCTHSLFCAPVMNSSRLMWPVELKEWKHPSSEFFLYNCRINTNRRCWRRPPGRCAGTPLLRWGWPLRPQHTQSLSLCCR